MSRLLSFSHRVRFEGGDRVALENGSGVQLGDERLARMTWADDNPLLATSVVQ